MKNFDDLVSLAKRHDGIPDSELTDLRATRGRLGRAKPIKIPCYSDSKCRAVKIAKIELTESIPDPYLMCIKALPSIGVTTMTRRFSLDFNTILRTAANVAPCARQQVVPALAKFTNLRNR